MKRILYLIISVVFLLGCSFSAKAEQNDYSLSLPDDFIAAAYGDDLTELAGVFDMNAESLQKYYDENKVLYLAANPQNTCQITLTCTENEFSKGITSFSLLSEAEIEAIADELAGESFKNHGVIQGSDGNPYIHLEKKLLDSGGDYTVTEYLTICSSNLFTLSISISELNKPDITPKAILTGLKINNTIAPQNNGNGLLYTVLTVFGIALFAAIAVYLTYTVIRDVRRIRASEDTEK